MFILFSHLASRLTACLRVSRVDPIELMIELRPSPFVGRGGVALSSPPGPAARWLLVSLRPSFERCVPAYTARQGDVRRSDDDPRRATVLPLATVPTQVGRRRAPRGAGRGHTAGTELRTLITVINVDVYLAARVSRTQQKVRYASSSVRRT